MKGILYGIGTGPGDPELMTVKAVRLLRGADAVVIPAASPEECMAYRTAVAAVPEISGKETVCTPFPMSTDRALLKRVHEKNADTVAQLLEAGKNVAFITIGDPAVYSTYSYIHDILSGRGYDARIISGVPSFCAAAASLGTILCEGNDTLSIIPASHSHAADQIAAAETGTAVIMKASRGYDAVRQALRAAGRDAVMAENCTLPDEKTYHSLPEFPDETGYFSIIITKGKR